MKKDKYKKYYKIEIFIIVAIFIGVYPILKVRDANIIDIRNSIIDKVNLEGMKEGNEKDLKKLYNINRNDIDSFIYYAPMSNMDENELLVLKVKDEEEISTIKENIKDRMDKREESFRTYRPEKYEIIKDAIIYEEGKYLIYIVSKDGPSIKTAIKKNFK